MMARVLLVVALASTGCLRGDGAFRCSADTSCGAGGTCAGGYCAFPDSSCPGGARYGALSGPFANQCVAAIDAGVDAAFFDAPIDAPIPTPMLVANAHGHNTAVTSIDVQLTIPSSGIKHVIVGVVSVSNGAAAAADPDPALTWVCPGAATLTLNVVADVRDAASHSRTQVWLRGAPATNMVCQLHVALASACVNVHVGALGFINVNQASPILNGQTSTGTATSAQNNMIASATTNLVVSTIGASTSISAHGASQTLVYTDDVTATALDNTSVTTARGAASVNQSFTVSAVGLWQIASVSLQP